MITAKKAGAVFVLIVGIFVTAAMPEPFAVYAAKDPEKQATQSSFDYKKYETDELYERALNIRMNSVYNIISDHLDPVPTVPIPGLIETCSSMDGRNTRSEMFVPQGMCRAGRYWLVTAYDSDKKCNTVIYAVDPLSRKLVSTVALPNKYHAGGIAFDGENIWITGDTSDKYKGDPFLQYIKFTDFEKMISKPFYCMSKDELSGRIYIKNKPSFLEYDDEILWAGTYKGRSSAKEAYMFGYRIKRKSDTADTGAEGGTADTETAGTGNAEPDEGGEVSLNTISCYVISGLDSSAQGVDIEGNYMYVSSSYKGSSAGVKSSFVTKYSIRPVKEGSTAVNVSEREMKRIEVPKMNEEILVENGCLYINFESGSETWKRAVINTDRILAVDQSLWN